MPIGINDDGIFTIDCSHDIAVATAKEGSSMLLAFDTAYSEENREFEPKAFLYFEVEKDVDDLIKTLLKVKKEFPKKKATPFYPETDEVPSESKNLL